MNNTKPLTVVERADRYHRQRTGRPMRLGEPMADLTPRQMRRIWHKEHRAWGKFADELGQPRRADGAK